MTDQELSAYIETYEKHRLERCKRFSAVFLPLEKLTHKETGVVHLSVSLSGAPAYITKRAALCRVVKVKMVFFLLPMTVSKLFTPSDFHAEFSEFLEDKIVDGEEFWFIPAEKNKAFKERIAAHPLDNTFRGHYLHEYISRF